MESKLKIDRKVLGARILYEIIENKKRNSREKKSIWRVFKSLSEDLGDDFMDYLDFEHFYWKLEKGECDVDYDGRLRYNRNLCELPLDIIRLIAEKLTIEEKFVFRESSLSIRKIIDSFLPGFKILEIRFDERTSVIFQGDDFDSQIRIDYFRERSVKTGELEILRYGMHSRLENGRRTVKESMIEDIRQILENPRTRLVELRISSFIRNENPFFENLKPLMESQQNVQKVFLSTNATSHFYSVLSGLKPETLEEIHLSSYEENMDLSGIVELDQVKQAKRITIWCVNATYPLSNLMNLEEFDGTRNILEPEDVLMIKNESTRTGTMKKFKVKTCEQVSLLRINELLGPRNLRFNGTFTQRHFRIQNSNKYMKLVISPTYFHLSRLDRILH